MPRCYSPGNLPGVLKNIHDAIAAADDSDVLWFTNVDYLLFMYLGLVRVRKKIVVTAYEDPAKRINSLGKHSFWKRPLVALLRKAARRGCSRVSLFVNSYERSGGEEQGNANCIFVPDFICDESYQAHARLAKADRVVCVGLVDSHKDIVGAVRCFQGLDIPLIVKGYFIDAAVYDTALALCTDNITVENTYLSEQEYLQLIAQSKYVLVPYVTEEYQGSRTSGIIREAIYLGATVIAPQEILTSMHFNGIGYRSLDEVRAFFAAGNRDEIPNDLTACTAQAITQKLSAALQGLQ